MKEIVSGCFSEQSV